MKRDLVDRLLQLAYLEGQLKTRGAYERVVGERVPALVASESARRSLQSLLERALERPDASSDAVLTIGGMLRRIRKEHSLRSTEISSRIGLSANIYRMMEHDRISPLKIHIDVWRKLRVLFNLPLEDLVQILRRTHQLVFFRPSFRMTLARYDGRKNKAMKSATLEQAATEMFSRATLALPEDEKMKLDSLIRSLKE
jgi:hypothetical protein